MLPKISIIMSAYNGAEHLPQQISSILNQSYRDWQLFIRDDNSSDNTLDIIESYARRYPDKVNVIRDKKRNIGISKSFLSLLNYVESDYVMFCDQDDIWLPDKIKITFDKMRETEEKFGLSTPVLIHTDLKVVDKRLNIVSDSFWRYQHLNPEKGKTLNRLLVQNVVTGCTMMINRALKNKIRFFPKQAIMHDWWASLVAAAFGKIDYVPTSTILYKQHDNSSIGAKEWGMGYMMKMARPRSGIKATLQKTRIQAGAFLDTFRNELTSEYLNLLDAYSTLDNQAFLIKRCNLIKYRFFKIGFFRNIGLFLTV